MQSAPPLRLRAVARSPVASSPERPSPSREAHQPRLLALRPSRLSEAALRAAPRLEIVIANAAGGDQLRGTASTRRCARRRERRCDRPTAHGPSLARPLPCELLRARLGLVKVGNPLGVDVDGCRLDLGSGAPTSTAPAPTRPSSPAPAAPSGWRSTRWNPTSPRPRTPATTRRWTRGKRQPRRQRLDRSRRRRHARLRLESDLGSERQPERG